MSLMKKFVLVAALSLLVLCSAAAVVWRLAVHRIAAREHAPELVRIHEPAEDFYFRTLDGNERRLSETKGRVVFVDLWGTWCIQCVAEMPTVQKLYDRYRNDPDVAFLIISRLDSAAAVRRFAAMHHYDLPFYTMDDANIPRSMRLNQYPATFLYAPDGSLAAQHAAAADWSDPSVAAFIDGLKAPQQ
jgi:thiol-disulfide isomerase/thioredoxin